jgi:hypothetical protein
VRVCENRPNARRPNVSVEAGPRNENYVALVQYMTLRHVVDDDVKIRLPAATQLPDTETQEFPVSTVPGMCSSTSSGMPASKI